MSADAKRLYIAATARNDGKTTVSVGLISVLRAEKGVGDLDGRGPRPLFPGTRAIGFIKPVGQRYQVVDGAQVDEDSVLVARLWPTEAALKDMSPVAIARHFTRDYIDRGDNEGLRQTILGAFERVAIGKDLVIIEGTGHAGVGSVIGLSNAEVARLLRSKVVLVTEGGIGRAVDEILLNKALFDSLGVPLVGVIVNKVLKEKYEEVVRYVTKALAANGIRALGFVPHEPALAASTVRQLWDALGGELLSGFKRLDEPVKDVLVGAMSPRRLLDYLGRPNVLLITPGDREDVILTAMISAQADRPSGADIAAVVLTGGVRPHRAVLDVLLAAGVPTILMEEDTYTVASRIAGHSVKMQPTDAGKIALAHDLAARHLDVPALLAAAEPLPR